jgi:hypothetical protein
MRIKKAVPYFLASCAVSVVLGSAAYSMDSSGVKLPSNPVGFPGVTIMVSPDQIGSTPEVLPKLLIEGLGEGTFLTGENLYIRLSNMPERILAKESYGFLMGSDNVIIKIQDYWSYDATRSEFSISGQSMRGLMKRLRPGRYILSFSFSGQDKENAIAYNLIVRKK